MNQSPEDKPRRAELLLKEADAVRAEIVYKMQLVHRVTLAILVAPTAVLPAMAKLAEQVAATKPGAGLGTKTELFDIVLLIVFVCLPLLLLWAYLFCQSQVNGIRRAGEWLRLMEQSLGLGETRSVHRGWETWIASGQRRLWDDDLYRYLTFALVALYYIATAVMASALIHNVASGVHWLTLVGLPQDRAEALAWLLPAALFAILFLLFINAVRAFVYRIESAPDVKPDRVAEAVLRSARLAYREAEGSLRHPYIVASIRRSNAQVEADPLRSLGETARVLGTYEELYDWDGIFCGAALLGQVAPLDQVLEGVVLNFLDAHEQNGFIPRTLTPQGTQIDPHELCKPLLAQGALAATRARGAQAWLDDQAFATLRAFVEHWLRERRGPSGMFMWRSALESGIDNNAALVHYPPLTIESVDATCFVAREAAALAVLAAERGDETLARRMRRQAADAQRALLARSWDEKAAFFWNRHVDTGHPVKIRSWTGLLPLWAGLAPGKVRERMINANLQVGGPFLTERGLTTLAADEVAFNAGRRTYIWDHIKQKRGEVSNWQGPTWVLPNALLCDALAANGHTGLARALCVGTVRTLARDLAISGTMHECYDTQTGLPLWANDFLSWNALAVRMTRWLRGDDVTILPDGLSSASLSVD